MKKNKNQNQIIPLFNVITIGDSHVGKTSILLRYTQNKFYENTQPTLGFEKSYKDLILKNGKKIRLCVLDTAGQEKYKSMNKSYVKNVDGVLFVFDLSEKATFFNIKNWLSFFNENNANLKMIPKYLIGNKKDLPKEVNNDMIEIILERIMNLNIKKLLLRMKMIIKLMNYFKKWVKNYILFI